MNKNFEDRGFDEYKYWVHQDIKTFNKINQLLQSIERDGILKGLGKPERLKYGAGYSRRIDEENRLVYDIKDDTIIIKACKGHY